MKKLLLSVCACLMGLSVQAGQEVSWQKDLNKERAEKAAREYFGDSNAISKGITYEDIYYAMKQFPNFLEWRFLGNHSTIVHLVITFGKNADVLRYLLGFSPDLTVADDNGEIPENDLYMGQGFKDVFENYRNHRWRHPEDVFERPIDHNQYIYDGKNFVRKLMGEGHGPNDNQPDHNNGAADEPLSKPSFLNNVLDRKVLGVLGTMILSAFIYRYYRTKHKNHIAAAA